MIYTFKQIQNIPKNSRSIFNSKYFKWRQIHNSGNQISLCARGKYNKMYGFKWRIKNDK